MDGAFKFSIKSFFNTFIFSFILCLFFEGVIFKTFLKITKIMPFNFNLLCVILITTFLTNIYLKKNLINILFINGCDRKEVASIKFFTSLIYNFICLIIYMLFEYIFLDLAFKIHKDVYIINIIIILFLINLVSEISTYLTLQYRKMAIKQGKGVEKIAYKYIYSVLFFIIIYLIRFFLNRFINQINGENFIISVILLSIIFILFIIFLFINRKNILNIDIRI